MGTRGHLLEWDGGRGDHPKAEVGQGIGNPPHTSHVAIPSCNLHSYCLCQKKNILLNLVKNDV